MSKRYEISKPSEGMKTLSAQFSLLRLEKTIHTAKKMRIQGRLEKDIHKLIRENHSDIDHTSRLKIYQLTLGKQPEDDISEAEVVSSNLHNPTTLELVLEVEKSDIQEGSFVFYKKQRWVVVGLKGCRMDLKQV
jgi:hypothetical protein